MEQPDSSRDGPDGARRAQRWSPPPEADVRGWIHSHQEPGSGDDGTLPDDPGPSVLIAAFGGWQDAGGAASGTLSQLAEAQGRRRLAAWRGASDASCPEDGWQDWHDLRMHRPQAVKGPDGRRHVKWPVLRVDRIPGPGGVDLLLAHGPEPDIGWDRISGHLLTLAAEQGAVGAIGLGAVAKDVPHTRPWPLTATSDDPEVRSDFRAGSPSCSGPLGFVDVLLSAADAAGWPTLHLVAGVPSYAGGPPQPVAKLRLLQTVDHLCGLSLDLDQAEEDARAWLRGADRLTKEDARIGHLVTRWEAEADHNDLPETSGEAIAAELERYLRRRGRD
ncbi:PAC2 family protein [Galactobacter sp.]|uniref:PAC2 family protein n=1 Tax=Galactobacter sp. TaxID=2676125 RepID=UPI0025BA32A9|nr:PAC2 family protein [Galactobacter sp.]